MFFRERRDGRLRVSFLIAALLTSCAIAGALMDPSLAWAVGSKPELKAAPVNPAYLEYWEKTESGGRPNGLMPSPVNWNLLKQNEKPRTAAIARAAALPSAFDLVDEGATPPVSNQNSWGTCWAFGVIEAIESGLLYADKSNGTDNYVALSELHLAYYAYIDEGPDKPAFVSKTLPPGYNPIFDAGGSPEKVIALLSRGTGPLAYDDAPYPDLEESEWPSYIPNPPPPKGPAQFRLKNSYYFNPDNPEDIKAALMKHGGLSIGYGDYDETVSGDSIYTPPDDGRVPTHLVMLVGWDDEYPKTAFLTQPKNDGAWKIQNSWGTEFGTDGFYWISYEDATIFGEPACWPSAYEMNPANAYNEIYFHDPLGMSGFLLNDGDYDVSVANAFTANRDEKIVAVGFNTAQADMDYEIQIYRNIKAGGAPDVEPVGAPVNHHVDDGGGYVTVELKDPVPIQKGERFAVAVTFERKAEGRLAIPIENGEVPGYEKAVFKRGESYYKMPGEQWNDLYDLDAGDSLPKGNFCVKAMTVPNGASDSSGGGCDTGLAAFASLIFAVGAAKVAAALSCRRNARH
jgi:C1A family cysteine protease